MRRRALLAAATSPACMAHAGAAAAPVRPRLQDAAPASGPFPSFFLGGFECSTHRRADGRRLDLIAATNHERLARSDYRQLAEHGMRGARDGVRWHLVEPGPPGAYDWSPVLPLLRAAQAEGVHVAWDLCHYGWPDGLDLFSAAFPERLAQYAAAFARLHLEETGRAPILCPVNEISFFAWAGGDMARMNPGARGRGMEVKRQLVRAAIGAAHAARRAAPGSQVLAVEPVIHVVPQRDRDEHLARTRYNEAQFQACDMLTGRLEPELGGDPGMLDLIGVNYYWNNQWSCAGAQGPDGLWHCEGAPLSPFDPRARRLSVLLAEVHARYRRPLLLAETSIEGDLRAAWLRHVAGEVGAALQHGVPIRGICLYPVLSHPGWDDDRYCANGLFEMQMRANGSGRLVHAPLAAELTDQQGRHWP